MIKAVLTFEAGILLCGQIRELLLNLRFRGHELEWREGRGWFSRSWTVKGDATVLKAFSEALDETFGDK